jgi:hypothetical protein
VRSNSLLNVQAMLACAMQAVAKDNPGQCEISADLWFPTYSLTLTIDAFADAFLQPALSTALMRRGPLKTRYRFKRPASHGQLDAYLSHGGIVGRLRGYHDVERDMMNAKIDIRVIH